MFILMQEVKTTIWPPMTCRSEEWSLLLIFTGSEQQVEENKYAIYVSAGGGQMTPLTGSMTLEQVNEKHMRSHNKPLEMFYLKRSDDIKWWEGSCPIYLQPVVQEGMDWEKHFLNWTVEYLIRIDIMVYQHLGILFLICASGQWKKYVAADVIT